MKKMKKWVVHLDMDSFILGAMDELFNTKSNTSLFYTRDYNMSPGRPIDKVYIMRLYKYMYVLISWWYWWWLFLLK
jgi:hypothetical protein